MTGQKRIFFVYDMMAGKITRIHGIRGKCNVQMIAFSASKLRISFWLGREERFFDRFVVSPDNNLLVFLGKDGYMPLVSNKVRSIPVLPLTSFPFHYCH